MLALQLLLTYLPAMNRIFGTAPIGWTEWAAILLVGWGASLVVGIEKRFRLFQAAARPDDKIQP